MIAFIAENAYLIALIPLLAAVLIFFVAIGNRSANRPAMGISIFATAVAFAMATVLIYGKATHQVALTSGSVRWMTTGSLDLVIGWSVDNLTALMLVIVTFVSLLVQIYSVEYMAHEKGVPRYFGSLSLFTFSMLLLVLADNLLVLYAGWELVGVSSYLLIGFFTFKPEAAAAAKKAFLVNRVGDFGFLIGIMILFFVTGHLQLDDISKTLALGKVPGDVLALACLLLFCGPIGKSAQFPLHVWLPDAMEGPTPVSALIHAATMVAAGVYFVAKVMGIFVQATTPLFGSFLVLDVVAWIGAITALLAASIALTQMDIKRVLAYSTVSQLGFMMMALGMYTLDNGKVIPVGYTAAIFHLFTHAFFKAMLFLCSGSVIHAVHSNDMRHMGGLHRYMPITSWTCLIGTASIAGFPFVTAGFWSKDEILLAMWEAHSPLFIVAALAATLTAFYMFRLYFLTFSGPYRGDESHPPHESGWCMTLPLMILALPSIAAGFIGTPWKNLFYDFIHFSATGGHEMATHHGLNPIVVGVSLTVFFVGTLTAWVMYGKAESPLPQQFADKFKVLYQLSWQRFYVDELYGWGVKWLVLGVAQVSYFVDKFVIDGLLINGLGLFAIGSSEGLKYTQSGKIQQYVLALISLLVMAIIMIMWTGVGIRHV